MAYIRIAHAIKIEIETGVDVYKRQAPYCCTIYQREKWFSNCTDSSETLLPSNH